MLCCVVHVGLESKRSIVRERAYERDGSSGGDIFSLELTALN